MAELHFMQMQILRELLFNSKASFSELNIQNMDSDHFSYHINSLIKIGYVAKTENKRYSLTVEGKQFASNIDVENSRLKKQPKVTAIVITTKKVNDTTLILLTTRLKTPFYGYHGFVGGKVKVHEKIIDTAKRELTEESGLVSRSMEYVYTIHETVVSTDGKMLEDKIFFVFHESDPHGDPIRTEEGDSFWLSEEGFYEYDMLFYDLIDLYDLLKNPPENRFIEKTYVIEEEQF